MHVAAWDRSHLRVSGEPRSWTTVENLTMRGVWTPGALHGICMGGRE